MAQSHDERLSGDLPLAPSEFEDEEKPSLSHNVVATYVADAVRSVEGVVGLHPPRGRASPPGCASCTPAASWSGTAVPGWSTSTFTCEWPGEPSFPSSPGRWKRPSASGVVALLSIDLGSVTLFVDGIAAPAEAGICKEG